MGQRKKKVAVGLSGGVDSSVTAGMLLEKGFDVIGITMVKYNEALPVRESIKASCYGPGEIKSIESAEAVCRDLDIPLHVIDIKKEFRTYVLDYLRKDYIEGKTPNPCIECNRRVKFGYLVEKAYAQGLDFDYFATGHYARIVESKGRFLLKKGVDSVKDQSYFLYTLTSEQLSRTLFPLGEYTKIQVKEMAPSFGLNTDKKPESQDFIADNGYSSLFRDQEIKEGEIVDGEGNCLGRHRGIIHYTIGQRKGLGIASPRPLYVKKLDAQKNRVIVCEKEELFSKRFVAGNINLIAIDHLDESHKIKVKIRYKHEAAGASLMPHNHDKAEVVFVEPQLSITPGQSAVFYVGDTVLGGGIIEETGDTYGR
ncbi:tRNA 2-thiouridine(34) synthase MnmA [Thermodesulfobacteriota bacterium]